MPKEKKQPSDFEFDTSREMGMPRAEVDALPFEKFTPEKPELPENDYLDDIPQTQNQQGQNNYSQPLMFNNEGKENLIIDLLKVDWERIEHIIRGHIPRTDPKTGDEYFVKMTNHYLNDYGVNSILHYLSFYLSKDIKLGRYSADDVKAIMKNFAQQFTDYFYDNINEFGLDTPEKKKMSKMFVHSVIDLVDASYSCAVEGRTIELMLKQFSVMQQEPLNYGGYNPTESPSRQKPSIMQRIFA